MTTAVFVRCPDCKGTGRGPKNLGTWCHKCQQFEHGYYPACGRCKGEKYVPLTAEMNDNHLPAPGEACPGHAPDGVPSESASTHGCLPIVSEARAQGAPGPVESKEK